MDDITFINQTSIIIERNLFSEIISVSPLLDNITKINKNLSIQITQQQLQQSWIQNIMVNVFPLYLIIFLLAVVGNVLVILTLVHNKRMRTVTNLFLLNLAISDLLLGIFCMPFTLVGMLLRDFIFGEMMCKLLPYLQGVYHAVLKLGYMLSRVMKNNHKKYKKDLGINPLDSNSLLKRR